MKKFRKALNKMPKKIVAFALVAVMLLGYILPITQVMAGEYGEGDITIRVNIQNNTSATLESATINSFAWVSDQDVFKTSDGKYHIVIGVSTNELTGDKIPDIIYGGNWSSYINKGTFTEEYGYSFVIDIDLDGATAEELETHNFLDLQVQLNDPQPDPPQQDPQPGGDNPGPGGGEHHEEEIHFDGKAYVLWSCGNGVCYHYFDDIPDFNDGKSKFYRASDEVIADNDSTKSFDVGAKYKGWYTKEGLETWVEDYELATGHAVNWATLDPEVVLGEPEQNVGQYEPGAIAAGCEKPADDAHWSEWDVFEACVNHYAATQGKIWTHQLQPLEEPQYPNAYVSYGDRNFKVVIYNDDYKGISYGNLSDLNYYPSQWANAYLMRDHFDISETTKENPTGIPAILLESTLNIKALGYNGFEITKIEALDVPEKAVTITKANDEWKLVFNSNFYDNVVFRATDSEGKEYYFQVGRYTIDGWIRGEGNHGVLTADFYFDKNDSYEDFNLTAKILYKDGTEKNVTLTAVDRIDDGLGNITEEFEVSEEDFRPAGKGLKRAVFEYELAEGEDRKIQDVYITAEYKGSTKTHYAGAYAGSGKGVLANIYHGEDE